MAAEPDEPLSTGTPPRGDEEIEDPGGSLTFADSPRIDPLNVNLDLHVPDADPPLAGWLDRELVRVAALAGVREGELNVTVVDDAVMADLHERYKDEPGTTDVLTFDLRDDPAGPVEGDVVICLDEATRQATQRGHAVRLEALLYVVHGLLHLLGEDDERPEDAARMHRREDALLTAAGFGAIYASNDLSCVSRIE